MDYNFTPNSSYIHNNLIGKNVYFPNIRKGLQCKVILVRDDGFFAEIKRNGIYQESGENNVVFVKYSK